MNLADGRDDEIRLVELDVVTAAGGHDLFADSRKCHQLRLRFLVLLVSGLVSGSVVVPSLASTSQCTPPARHVRSREAADLMLNDLATRHSP